ncbi:MAG: hypothetical protein WDW38_005379 [Sanguina aurantia]
MRTLLLLVGPLMSVGSSLRSALLSPLLPFWLVIALLPFGRSSEFGTFLCLIGVILPRGWLEQHAALLYPRLLLWMLAAYVGAQAEAHGALGDEERVEVSRLVTRIKAQDPRPSTSTSPTSPTAATAAAAAAVAATPVSSPSTEAGSTHAGLTAAQAASDPHALGEHRAGSKAGSLDTTLWGMVRSMGPDAMSSAPVGLSLVDRPLLGWRRHGATSSCVRASAAAAVQSHLPVRELSSHDLHLSSVGDGDLSSNTVTHGSGTAESAGSTWSSDRTSSNRATTERSTNTGKHIGSSSSSSSSNTSDTNSGSSNLAGDAFCNGRSLTSSITDGSSLQWSAPWCAMPQQPQQQLPALLGLYHLMESRLDAVFSAAFRITLASIAQAEVNVQASDFAAQASQ